jgi:membrane-associated phospholipid phosphatase
MRLKPRSRASRRRAAIVVATFGFLEAASLLYIGVHYLTDVLGALAVSLAWLGTMRALFPPVAYNPVPPTGFHPLPGEP